MLKRYEALESFEHSVLFIFLVLKQTWENYLAKDLFPYIKSLYVFVEKMQFLRVKLPLYVIPEINFKSFEV